MKKLMFGLVAAAAMMAMGADAIESDPVGFINKNNIPKNYTILPISFDQLNGEATVDVLKYISFGSVLTPYSLSEESKCVQILVQNGDGYTYYAYATDGLDQSSWEETEGWANTADGLVYDEIPVTPGQGVWIKNPNDVAMQLNLSGGVIADKSKTVTLGTYAYNLCGNPYPVDTAFEDIQWANLAAVSQAEASTGIQILTQKGDGYSFYLYSNDGLDQSSWEEATGWTDTADGLIYTGVFAKAGEGFWLYAPKGSTAKATFFNPLAK